MGKIFDLAKALAGEKSLHGSFGRWIQAVSRALDDGAATPDYGIVKKGPALATVGVNDTLPLEVEGPMRGVTYQGYSWILTPGKTYLLQADGWFNNFSNPATGLLDVAWVDDNNTYLQAPTMDSPSARFRPVTSTDPNSSGGGGLSMIYTVPSGDVNLRIAKLRVMGAAGTADMLSGSWTSTVLEIPG